MRISAIQNYQIQSNNKQRKIVANKNVQPSFQSGKGALWGALGGAGFGAAVIVLTGGLGAIPLGMAAAATAVYGGVGAAIGESITSDDNSNDTGAKHPLADGNGFLHIH